MAVINQAGAVPMDVKVGSVLGEYQRGIPYGSFLLYIEPSNPSVKVGTQPEIVIRLENTSDHEIEFDFSKVVLTVHCEKREVGKYRLPAKAAAWKVKVAANGFVGIRMWLGEDRTLPVGTFSIGGYYELSPYEFQNVAGTRKLVIVE